MATVREVIPEALPPKVDAACTWFNDAQSDAFEVTGIVDAETTLVGWHQLAGIG